MGYASRRGKAVQKSVSEAMFAALFGLVEREGWPYVKRLSGVSKTTAGRWAQEFKAGESPGFNRESFDSLMKLEEVRGAVAAAAGGEPDSDSAKWRAIAGALAEIMQPDDGWALVRSLRKMKALGIFDPRFSLLRGVIEQREGSVAPDAPVRKLSKKQANQAD